jgi:hypothetical protein
MVDSHLRLRFGKIVCLDNAGIPWPSGHFFGGVAENLNAIRAELASKMRLLDSALACPSYAERYRM